MIAVVSNVPRPLTDARNASYLTWIDEAKGAGSETPSAPTSSATIRVRISPEMLR